MEQVKTPNGRLKKTVISGSFYSYHEADPITMDRGHGMLDIHKYGVHMSVSCG